MAGVCDHIMRLISPKNVKPMSETVMIRCCMDNRCQIADNWEMSCLKNSDIVHSFERIAGL